ncbi:MAG: hypothetical protein GXZ15_03340, partial [Campylobacter sp.]|nr:hypothetical protein [Campylobacter sp.]
MRKLIVVLFLSLFVFGCSSKNSILNLHSYNAISKSAPIFKSIYISDVKDSRESKNLVGTIKDGDGNIKEYIVLNQSLDLWFKDALSKELNSRGISVETNPAASVDAIVKADISKFNAILMGFDKENLSGEAAVAIELKKADKSITKQISQKQSEFVVIKNSSAFSPFMLNLLNDIVVKSAENIENS